jgi:hypothetical protein
MALFRCRNGLVQACVIFNENSQSHPEVIASEMFNEEHDALSIIVVLLLTFLLMSSLAILAVFYVKKWQRRVRFFAHARLNENVEEITNPIFDFSATDRDDINLPVTSISNSDDKVGQASILKMIKNNLFFITSRVTFQIQYTSPCTRHPTKASSRESPTTTRKSPKTSYYDCQIIPPIVYCRNTECVLATRFMSILYGMIV